MHRLKKKNCINISIDAKDAGKKPTEYFSYCQTVRIHSHKRQKLCLPSLRASGKWNTVNGISQDEARD